MFQKENRSYLFNHLTEESADPLIPYNPDTIMQRRYLYHAKRRLRFMKAKDLDKKFDSGKILPNSLIRQMLEDLGRNRKELM